MSNLSVLMSTFNESKKELDASIDSILNQTYSNFVFIIVDDNPGSISLKKYLLYKQSKDNRIHILFHKHNMGLVRSLNDGLSHIHTKLIARMDADDISLPNRFTSQINFMKKNNVDICFTNSESIYGNKRNENGVFFNEDITNQKLLKYIFYNYGNFALHSTWMLNSSVYKVLRGYRNVMAAEDFDFIIRAMTYHYKLGYLSKKLFIWRKRRNGISKSHSFEQFISSQILHHAIKEMKFKKILPLNVIYKYQHKFITTKAKKKFKLFIRYGHNVKYNFTFLYLFKFIYSVLFSYLSLKYMICVLSSPLRKKKVVDAIKTYRK